MEIGSELKKFYVQLEDHNYLKYFFVFKQNTNKDLQFLFRSRSLAENHKIACRYR